VAGDLKAEGGGKVTRGSSVTVSYAAPYRLLLLLKLLPSIKRMSLEEHDKLAGPEAGDFIELDCPGFEMALLPQLGDYWHLILANEEWSRSEKLSPQEEREARRGTKGHNSANEKR
jgi:hypothetical protein